MYNSRGLSGWLVEWVDASAADSLLILLDDPTDWAALREAARETRVLIATDVAEAIEGAEEAGLSYVVLEMGNAPSRRNSPKRFCSRSLANCCFLARRSSPCTRFRGGADGFAELHSSGRASWGD